MFNQLERARNKMRRGSGDFAEHLPTSTEVAEDKFGKPGVVDLIADAYEAIKAKVTHSKPPLNPFHKTVDMTIHPTSDPSDLTIDPLPVIPNKDTGNMYADINQSDPNVSPKQASPKESSTLAEKFFHLKDNSLKKTNEK
jgi:hypothetical protein